MPAISELPDTLSAITGNELLPIVQDAETRQATLSALLSASPPRQAQNARWIKLNASGFITETDLTFSYDPNDSIASKLNAFAKADIQRAPTDILFWEYEFTPLLIEDPNFNSTDLSFDGSSSEVGVGQRFLENGRFRFTVTSGDLSATNTVELHEARYDGQTIHVLHTFTAIGQTYDIDAPPGKPLYLKVVQPEPGPFIAAVINERQTHYYAWSGVIPQFTTNGDLLRVTTDGAPKPGQLTARARLYDGNGVLLAESNVITLHLIETAPGGGGA